MATIRELRARFSASAQGFQQAIQGINQGMESVGESGDQASKKANDGFSKLKDTLIKFAGAYVGWEAIKTGVGGVLSVTDEYQKAMNSLQVQTGANNSEMAGYSKQLQDIYSSNYGDSFQDIADSMTNIKQATGLSGDALTDLTKKALLLRDSMGYEVSESTATASVMMKQFGITGDQAMTLIAQGSQKGLDKNQDMLDSFNEYSVYFKQLGFDAEGMWNVFKAGSDAGAFNMDKVGDAMKEFGLRVKDGSKTTDQAFTSMGLDTDKMSHMFAKGGESSQKALAMTFDALGKIKDPIARNTASVSLFGTQFEDLGEKTVQALGKVGNTANMTGDTLKKMDAVKYNNIGSAFEGLKRQIITGLLDPIQGHVMPMLNTFINFMIKNMPSIKNAIVNAFSGIMSVIEFLQPAFANLWTILSNVGSIVIPILVTAIKGILAVVLPVATAITDVVAKFTSWEGFIPVVLGLATAFGTYLAITKASLVYTKLMSTAVKLWALAQEGLNLVMSLNPIALIVALIIGLVVAIIYAYNHSERFRQIVQGAWQGIKDVVSAVINWFVTTIPQWIAGLVAFFTGMGSSIASIWNTMINAIVNFFTGLWASITSIATSIWTFLVGIWTTISTTVSGVVSAFVSMVVGYITNLVTNIMNFFSPITTFFVNTWNNIKLLVLGIIGVFLNLLIGNFEGVKISLLGIWTAITRQITNIITMFKDMAINIFNGLKTVVVTVFNALKTGVLAIWNGLKIGTLAIINGLKTGFIAVVNGIKTGAINGWNALKTGAINSVNALKTGAINSVNALKSGFINTVNAIKNGIVNGFNSAKTSAINTFNALKTGVSNAIQGVIGFVTGMKSKVVSTISGINLKQIGVNIIQGLINGIKSMVGAVGKAITSVAGSVTNKIKSALGIHSPSRVMIEMGQYTGQGLANGIQNMKDSVAKATQSLADASFGTINSQSLNPITATVDASPGQSDQTTTETTTNQINIDKYYQNTDTDARALSTQLFGLDRASKRKKGK
jgi:phage-related minor tail protein